MTDAASVFADAVKQYIELHDQITEAGKQLREVRQRKEELAQIILQFMKSNDIDECAVRDGKLVRRESKSTEGIKKDHIIDELKDVVGESEAKALLDRINSKRETRTKESLARRKSKA